MQRYYLHIIISCISLLIISSSPLSAQQKVFDYMDIFDLQMVSSPQISPDGSRIVYERHQFDMMTDRRFVNLWQIDFEGTNHRPLTSGKDSYGSVVWSPDGSRIAYTSSEEGSTQIFIRWMESGQAASLTNLDGSPGNLSWSPDGSHLLFTKQVDAEKPEIGSFPGPPEGADWASPAKVIDHVIYRQDGQGYTDLSYSHIFILPAEGGAPRQITSGPYDHNSPSWSPDGTSIG